MHVSRKAALRFGSPALNPEERDTVQVGLAGAVSSKDKSFRTMHDKCEAPMRELRICSNCAELVEPEHIVSGYELVKNQFIMFSPEEIAGLEVEKTPFIDITKFIPRSEFEEYVMLDKQYYLIPNTEMPGKYGVLYQVLTTTKAVGTGSTTMWGKEHPVAVFPKNGVLMMALLVLLEDMVEPDFTSPVPSKAALAEFRPQVTALMGHLELEDLGSESRRRKSDLIQLRLDHPVGSPPPDLVAELKKTVKAQKKVKS